MHLKDYKFLLRLNILVHLLVKHRGSPYPYTIITWLTTSHEFLSQASSFKANRHTISEKRHHANLLLNRSTVEVRSVGPSIISPPIEIKIFAVPFRARIIVPRIHNYRFHKVKKVVTHFVFWVSSGSSTATAHTSQPTAPPLRGRTGPYRVEYVLQ